VFGREKEEPSPQERLAGAGATTQPAGTVTDEPHGPREGLILLLFAILTVAASAFVLWNDEQSAVDDPAQQVARGEVHGLSNLSMLREPNVKRVLDTVSKGKWPLVRNIRIAPGQIDVQVSDKDGYERRLSFDPAFKMTNDDSGVSEQNSVPASKIDAGAPEKMVRSLAERAQISPDAVDYVTNSYLIDDKSDWFMALDQGPARVRQWVAEPDGRDLRHPGEPSTAERQAQQRQKRQADRQRRQVQRQVARQQRQAQRLSNCLTGSTTTQQVQQCYQRFQP
jgi:hypothetical protein